MIICMELNRAWPCLMIVLALMQSVSAHGAYHDVVRKIREQLKQQPDNAALHFKLAQAHVGHEEASACLEELKVVENLAPGAYPTAPLRGLALSIAGKDEQSRAGHETVRENHPGETGGMAHPIGHGDAALVPPVGR